MIIIVSMFNERALQNLVDQYMDDAPDETYHSNAERSYVQQFAKDIVILMKNSGATVQNIHHLR